MAPEEAVGAGDENSLDLHLDISLPEIVLESPAKGSASSPVQPTVMMASASPNPDGPKASELLMSDERELLKDLMCFHDSEQSAQKQHQQTEQLKSSHQQY